MVEVTLVVRQPGKESVETDFLFEFPEVPRVGDCISICGPDQRQPLSRDFIVRKIWWRLHHPTDGGGDPNEIIKGNVIELMAECDIAEGPYTSQAHLDYIKIARAKGIEVEDFGIGRRRVY